MSTPTPTPPAVFAAESSAHAVSKQAPTPVLTTSSSSLSPAPRAAAAVSAAVSAAAAPAASSEPRLSFVGLLRSLVSRYESFVAESAWYTGLLETAKTFSVFLPGRFSDTDLRGEFAYMGLCLLSYYHDGICARPRSHPSRLKLSGRPALLTAREPGAVRILNALLFVISSSECLLELAAGHWHSTRSAPERAALLAATPGAAFQAPLLARFAAATQRFRMRAVVAVEAAKLLLRLLLLWRNRGKMLLPADAADVHAELAQRQAELAAEAAERAAAERARAQAAHLSAIWRAHKAAVANNNNNKNNGGADDDAAADVTTVTTPAAAATAAAATTAVTGGSDSAASATAVNTAAATSVTGDPLAAVSAVTGANGRDEEPLAALAGASLRRLYQRHGRGALPHGQFAPAPTSAAPRSERARTAAPAGAALGEALYWARPLVYAALKLKFGAQAWLPLAASLAVDAIAYALAARGSELSPAQSAAWAVRRRLYLFYLLRSPVFDAVTVVPLQAIADIAAYIPVLGGFVNAVIEVGFNLQQNHFYTSAS